MLNFLIASIVSLIIPYGIQAGNAKNKWVGNKIRIATVAYLEHTNIHAINLSIRIRLKSCVQKLSKILQISGQTSF